MTIEHDEAPEPAPDEGHFDRFATKVGDLDSPFYDEERDRDVWNEASAVGFQLMLWGIPLVAAPSLWIGGPAAMPYALTMLGPWTVAAIVTTSYAHRRGVDPGNPQARRNATVRLWLFAVVMAAVASGFLRAASLLDVEPGSNVDSFLRGAAQGSGVAFIVVTALAVVFATHHALRRRRTSS